MSKSLKDTIREHVVEPAVAALVIQNVMEPLNGKAAEIAPPTYARATGDNSKAPNYAYTESAFFPACDSKGWYSHIAYRADGAPREAAQVLLDSTGSQSGRAETALWKEREMLRHTLPALILTGEIDQKLKDSKVSQLTTKARETAQALGIEVSSWEAAHRQIDTWFRAATMPDDKEHQLWDDSAKPATRKVKQVISTASANNGDLLYTYFPNAAIFGFWLSSGSSVRNKMPRAYSSEIVGYGAHPVRRASTKLDPVGGASKNTGIEFDGSRYVLTGKKVTEATRPSNLGFGQVPSAVEVRGFVCELIVQQAAISLGVLRSIVFHDSDGHTAKERATAAQTVLCLLALLGWKLSSQEGFLRSGCSLVSTDVKWGWRRHGSSEVEEMDVPSRDEIRDALDEAIDDAVAVGLPFADQTILHFSEEERQLITERVNEEIKTAGSDGE